MEIIMIGSISLVLAAFLFIGYYSFYLTTFVKRRNEAEMFALYPASEGCYTTLAKTEHTIFSREGLSLFAELYQAEQPRKKVVILVHGYKNNRIASLQYVPLFLSLGYDVVTIDQRSHGRSKGKFATYGHLEQDDLRRWLTYFGGDYQEIGLHGHSMGGSTVLALADHPKVQFIMSEAGLPSAVEGVLSHVQNRMKLPKWLSYIVVYATNIYTCLFARFSLFKTNPGKVAENSQTPLFLIHGTADDVVPSWLSEKLIRNKQTGHAKLWLIPNGDHKTLYQSQPDAYNQQIIEFLAEIKNPSYSK
ncbi:MAG: alpha/beta hydrolase [Culicoidibacterales bacterium]